MTVHPDTGRVVTAAQRAGPAVEVRVHNFAANPRELFTAPGGRGG